MPKEAYWFRHDANARNDPKMLRLLRLGGQAAKGSFWDLIETMRETDGYRLTISQAEDVAFAYHFPSEAIEQMKRCDLIQTDGEFVWSDSLLRRMSKWDEKRQKLAVAGRKGGEARAANIANATECEAKATKIVAKGQGSLKPGLGKSYKKCSREEKRRSDKSKESATWEVAGRLCSFMLNEIRAEKPDSTVKITKAWQADMDKLMRRDGRSEERVRQVIRWACHHDFWRANVLCPSKLRKKFDTLEMQMARESGVGKANNQPRADCLPSGLFVPRGSTLADAIRRAVDREGATPLMVDAWKREIATWETKHGPATNRGDLEAL